MAFLTTSSPSVAKRQFSIDKDEITIGREEKNDLHIKDETVSRWHAKVTKKDGNYYIEDNKSRNGTLLNNQTVLQPTQLPDQSEIQICDVTFIFSNGDVSSRKSNLEQFTVAQGLNNDPTSSSINQSSVMFDEFEESGDVSASVSSRLDIPSHHARSDNHAKPEEKLRALTKITHALSESVERDEVLTKILDCLFQLFTEADRGFIVLKNDEGKLEPLGFKTRGARTDEMVRISKTICKTVMGNKHPIISSDAAIDDRFDMSQSIVDFRIRSIMCAPLINSKDEAIGVIQLDTLKQSIAFDNEDLETLVTVAMQASLAIQKSDLFLDFKRAQSIRADLELAHELQQRFLPQSSPDTEEFEFFSFYRPMQQVGGDYYDFVPLENNRIAIIMADVVGHGIAAALYMAKISAESRFALATSKTAVEAVHKMNNSLSGLNIDRFVTLALCVLDLDTNKMTVVNAGHMPPILQKSATGEITQLAMEESGLPLGIMEDYEYESIEVQIDPGDQIVLYTDGINEAMNADGDQLTTEAMIKEMASGQAKNPDAIGNLIRESVARHSGRHPAIDDMCLVCLGRKP
jgi:serine phosphatase RsbU (regulator of sigma subunit)/pSer/pThr/pTyr-binding forkhead associated (FHA) protein